MKFIIFALNQFEKNCHISKGGIIGYLVNENFLKPLLKGYKKENIYSWRNHNIQVKIL
jgi:hypothetical protein